MKIAIHHRKGSFSDRWIDYCKSNNIDYKLVNAYHTDIIKHVEDCDAFMWHWHHNYPKDILFARQLIYSLEQKGLKVFPDSKTVWHFDDKVGQKYLLEAIGAPLVKSYVFYDKTEALDWVKKTDFPKVFKLRGGAGSSNVELAKNKKNAIYLIKKAFGKGFAPINRFQIFKDLIRNDKNILNLNYLISLLKSFVLLFINTNFEKVKGVESGYIYFQDFIPNNTSDIRIIVIKDKAFAIERFTRDGDFRASGSGRIKYLDNNSIDIECIRIAFETNNTLEAQCLAYDFVYDKSNKPLIVEISYGFAIEAYDPCIGYWDDNLNWIEGNFNPQAWMVNSLINEI